VNAKKDAKRAEGQQQREGQRDEKPPEATSDETANVVPPEGPDLARLVTLAR
jgi:hypothetical protein